MRAPEDSEQGQVSRAGTSNYIPQYLRDGVTFPCSSYLFLAQHSSIQPVNDICLVVSVVSVVSVFWVIRRKVISYRWIQFGPAHKHVDVCNSTMYQFINIWQLAPYILPLLLFLNISHVLPIVFPRIWFYYEICFYTRCFVPSYSIAIVSGLNTGIKSELLISGPLFTKR